MLFNLLVPLADDYIVFNLFRYLTFRTGGAIMTALLVSFLFGPAIINWLKSAQNGNTPVREDVPEGHLKKVGTPTMGGFLILLAISISTLLWADLRNGYVWVVLLVTIGFGAVGFAGRLPEIDRPSLEGTTRPRQTHIGNHHRGSRGLLGDGDHAGTACGRLGHSFLQGRLDQPRLVLHPVRYLRYGRRLECR